MGVNVKLDGRDYVILPRVEFDRLAGLAKVAELPTLPDAGADGNYPAVDYARASLARNIIRKRVEAGLTQRELAKRAGIRHETLCRLESGKHTPSVATITRIERALQPGKHKRNGR
ncbi:MAG: helix-turn-helix transcriptional regulator [Planctomycetes bacterium]|nr:helix-turn-helix transcriptional regulator [Planctomycetota bacterium]